MDPISQIAKDLNIDVDQLKITDKRQSPALQVAQEVIKKLGEKSGLNTQMKVSIETNQSIFDLNASVSGKNGYVYLPPLYFVERDMVPFTGPDDPKLENKEILQRFANRLAYQLKIPPKKVTWEDRMHLRMYLAATEKRERIKDTVNFILMHELGHVFGDHQKRKLDYKKKLSEPLFTIINVLTLGIFKTAALDLQSRKHEKEADSFAYKSELPNTSLGGIHLFKTVEKFKPKGTVETMAYALFCFSTLASHGTYGARRKYIESHMKRPPPSPPKSSSNESGEQI